jgi:hypothetical protein
MASRARRSGLAAAFLVFGVATAATPPLAGCGDRKSRTSPPAAPASPQVQGTGPGEAPGAQAEPTRAVVADAAPDETDASPIAPGDVLEGAAAEAAMAEAGAGARSDAGVPAGGAAAGGDQGLRPDGVGPFRLGQTRAEVAALIAPAILYRLPSPAGAARSEEARLAGALGPWLRLRVFAGRLVEVEVLSRDGRAMTDEGIGVGATFEDATLAHGEARAVRDSKTGKVRGYVLADLPGVLWVPLPGRPAPAPRPVDAGDGEEGTADGDAPNPEVRPGALVWRVLVVGPEALAPPD